jgi:hypothetical protein
MEAASTFGSLRTIANGEAYPDASLLRKRTESSISGKPAKRRKRKKDFKNAAVGPARTIPKVKFKRQLYCEYSIIHFSVPLTHSKSISIPTSTCNNLLAIWVLSNLNRF